MYIYTEFEKFETHLDSFLIDDLINIIYDYYRLHTIDSNIVYSDNHYIICLPYYDKIEIMEDTITSLKNKTLDLYNMKSDFKNCNFKEIYYFENKDNFCKYEKSMLFYNTSIIIGKLNSNKYFELYLIYFTIMITTPTGFDHTNGDFFRFRTYNNFDDLKIDVNIKNFIIFSQLIDPSISIIDNFKFSVSKNLVSQDGNFLLKFKQIKNK